MTPPSVREASRVIGAPPDAIRAMLQIGVERGEIADAGEGVYFAVETLHTLAEQLREPAAAHQGRPSARFDGQLASLRRRRAALAARTGQAPLSRARERG
jgi:hypothetical protein